MATTTSAEPANEPRRRTPMVAWLGVAALQITVAFAFAGGERAPDSEPLYGYDLAVGSLVVYGLLVGVTFWIAASYPSPRAALGLRAFTPRWFGIAAALVIASLVVGGLLEPILHAGEEQGLAPERWRPDRAGAFLVNAVVITTLVPFTEELFFRGLGVRALAFFGSIAAVLGSAFVFALAHGLLVALPPLFFFAVGLAWVRLRSGSVWPGILAHAAYNGVGIAVAYFSVQ